MKKIILITSTLILASCSFGETGINKIDSDKIKISNQDSNTILVDLGKESGVQFSAKINLTEGFKTKASVSGAVEKKLTDISKVDVYLLSLTSVPTAGSNPLGVANANVITSFTGGSALSKTGASFNVLFKNVPGLATNQYFVGVVLKDSANNVINKAPGTPWTLDTLTTAPALAVSSSGIGVNTTTLAVSTSTALSISVNLLDAFGAQVDSTITATAGTNALTAAGIVAQ
ncbi:MAG: hypothetical protein AABZ74_16675 [Cyanobacteriota bacterium]